MAEQDQQGRPAFAGDRFPQVLDRHAVAGLAFRVLLLDPQHDRLHVPAGLGKCDRLLQPREGIEGIVLFARLMGSSRPQRHVEIRPSQKIKPTRCYADNGMRTVPQRDHGPHDRRLGAEPGAPEPLREDRDGRRSGPIVVRQEIAAHQRHHAQCAKIVTADIGAHDPLRPLSPGQNEVSPALGGHRGKHLVFFLPLQEVGIRDGIARAVAGGFTEQDQTLRVFHRQRSPQQGVHRGVNGAVQRRSPAPASPRPRP